MLKVYGIPNCGTVKKARKWLDGRDADYVFVDFRKEPPDAADVAEWVKELGSKAMRNTSGGSYRALGDEKKEWDDDRWATEFAKDPMLIKRPLITKLERAVQVGFRGTEDDFERVLL